MVLGSFGVFAAIGVFLFRKVRVALAQTQEVLELLGEFSEQMGSIEPPTYEFTPGLGADAAQKAQWRHRRRINLVRRAQRKQGRRAQTLARWRSAPTEAARR